MTVTIRKSILVVAPFVVAAAIGTVPAIAATPQTTTFAVVESFETGTGVFTSNGSVLCASGTTTNVFLGTGGQSDRGLILHDLKTITCDDGSGSFTLLINGRTGFNVGEGTFAQWVVVSGTGDYANLHGRGTETGTYTDDGLSEIYVGWLA